MNKVRRNEIKKAIELIEQAREILEIVADDEQEAFDNMPESIQTSERGEQMETYIYEITDFLDTLDTETLQDIID